MFLPFFSLGWNSSQNLIGITFCSKIWNPRVQNTHTHSHEPFSVLAQLGSHCSWLKTWRHLIYSCTHQANNTNEPSPLDIDGGKKKRQNRMLKSSSPWACSQAAITKRQVSLESESQCAGTSEDGSVISV